MLLTSRLVRSHACCKGDGEMLNLIKTEFFKLRKSFAYKFMLGTYLLFEVWYNMNEVSNGILYTGVSYTGSEWFFQMPPLLYADTRVKRFFLPKRLYL